MKTSSLFETRELLIILIKSYTIIIEYYDSYNDFMVTTHWSDLRNENVQISLSLCHTIYANIYTFQIFNHIRPS